MEDIKINLKPKKKSFLDKLKGLFEDKKKRYLYMILFMLPFIIAIGIFSYIAVREAKNIVELATGEVEIKDEYHIPSMGYVLRNNATNYQFESFTEMKNAIESGTADDQTIAGMVCKNFVIDFYTWTNKQGQYDVGGMCYLYDGEFEDGTKAKENFYLNARTGFYRYINKYIKDYGVANLLEVENVQVSSTKTDNFIINEHVANKQDENGEWYDYREDTPYQAYKVNCTWNYKNNAKFDTSGFATSMNFLVIKEGERFVIVAANENEIKTDRVEIKQEEPSENENIDEEAVEDENAEFEEE